jgi:hypothetical protein
MQPREWAPNEPEQTEKNVHTFSVPPPLSDLTPSEPSAARGFGQAWDLHPGTAAFAMSSDCMCSAVDVASLGMTAPFLWLIAGLVNGVVVFVGQRKWAGDDVQEACLKSLIVGFLVALPTPFPSFLTVPSAIAGAVRMLRRKS